ncbi:MAG: CbiX/SirB N-terminal domain-containing protein [Rubrivivax sp.]|nr:CbiX/SirB N-terminal domain-containing protein [Rubrivivax sp.]
MSQGLILFGHGARDPAWAAPFEAVAARLRALSPRLAVRLAFLEFMAPSLGEAGTELAGAGCRSVAIVPMFLGTGGHVRHDLPLQLAQLQASHPAVNFVLHTAIGEVVSVHEAMALAILGGLDSSARGSSVR